VALYPSRVAPLFTARCEHCHSGKEPSGGLAIGTHAALLRGGDTGPAVTPGKPEASVLVTRIRLPLDDGDHMPPEGETQLTADEVALVAAWVQTGADEARELDTASLPAAALRTLAAPPAASERTAPNGSPAPASPAPKAAPGGPGSPPSAVSDNTPQGRSGGCAACMVAEHRDAPAIAPWLAGAAGVTLVLRRRAVKRPDIHGGLRSG
jgi:hypothetical protein